MFECDVITIFQKMDGGSTEPILVSAINESGEVIDYVLKLYKVELERTYYPTFKEFVVNYLINEFDLTTPPAILAKIPPLLVRENNKKYSQFNHRNIGNFNFSTGKFALEYVEANPVGFNYTFNFDITEFSNIYAFDFLILNNDRGGQNKKSNLLVDDTGFILIDHEISLNFIDNKNSIDAKLDFDINSEDLEMSDESILEGIIRDFKAGRTNYNYKAHVFYEKLVEYEEKDKIFEDFFYYLEGFSVNRFEVYLKEMQSKDITCNGTSLLIEYIKFVKDNLSDFKRVLYKSIGHE